MKKIIKLAEKATEVFDHPFDEYLEAVNELRTALAHRKILEQTPITEDWLKEHGFVKNEYRCWEYDLVMDDGRTEIRYYKSGGEPTATMSIYKNIDFEDEVCYELPEPYTLADLLDAMELCGIEMEDEK